MTVEDKIVGLFKLRGPCEYGLTSAQISIAINEPLALVEETLEGLEVLGLVKQIAYDSIFKHDQVADKRIKLYLEVQSSI